MLLNLGIPDRIVRLLLAIIISYLFLTDIIYGVTAMVLGGVAFVLAITALIGSDPLYLPFNISTRRKKEIK
ncbi:MAG: DUF2892 domain-containing protein [Bacteroidota bacterium]